MVEVEIKFQIDDEKIDLVLKEMVELDILNSRVLEKSKTKNYETIYLDTKTHYFQKNNCVLRFRRQESKNKSTLDFKWDLASEGGVFRRVELSRPLDKKNWYEITKNDIHQLLVEGFENQKNGMNIKREEIASLLNEGEIIKLFSISMKRKIFDLEIEGSKIELSIDKCKGMNQRKSISFVEIEGELIEGNEDILLKLKEKLNQIDGIREVKKSKFQRGLELLN